MQYSNCGRVVVVDDKYEEAKPLLQAFSKNGIPYTYFDGDIQSLPESPFEGIRFIFLDIQLKAGIREQKSIASHLASVLRKIISKDNGPYVILFWSRHKEIIEKVVENCLKISTNLVSWLDLEKHECLTAENSYDLSVISQKLKEKLSELGAFQLYVEWENTVNDASKQFVLEFSNLVRDTTGKKWSQQTSALFYKLYKQYVDKNDTNEQQERFKFAGHVMNKSFYDTLQSKTYNSLSMPEGFKINGGDVRSLAVSKINTSLLLDLHATNPIKSGSVFLLNKTKLKNDLISSIFVKNDSLKNTRLLELIITPECDLAQRKTLKEVTNNDGNRDESTIHRVLYGLMFETSENINNLRNSNGAFFEIGKVWYNKKEKYIIIHLATISFKSEKDFTKPVFALKRDLLFDLQSKASNHVNRLGNMQIK